MTTAVIPITNWAMVTLGSKASHPAEVKSAAMAVPENVSMAQSAPAYVQVRTRQAPRTSPEEHKLSPDLHPDREKRAPVSPSSPAPNVPSPYTPRAIGGRTIIGNIFQSEGGTTFDYQGDGGWFADNAVQGYGQVHIGGSGYVTGNQFSTGSEIDKANMLIRQRAPILKNITQKYLTEHPAADRSMELAPEDYVNSQLAALGQNWRIKMADRTSFLMQDAPLSESSQSPAAKP
jgi:hypothetical protein